jgi:hypothetical protein
MASTTKLWVGLGSVMLLSGSGAQAVAGEAAAPAPAKAARPPLQGSAPATAAHQAGPGSIWMLIAAGGEGGEGGEAGTNAEEDAFSKMSRDEQLVGRLLLILGHYRVGEELLRAGKPDGALPHFHHPIEEIYKVVKPDLVKRGVHGFKPALDGLMKASEQKQPVEKIMAQLKTARAAVADAMGKVDPAWKTSPSFVFDIVVGLAQSAADEYEEAIKDGRIAEIVEYEDGRGFMGEAQAFWTAHAAVLKGKDAAAFEEAGKILAGQMQVWPTLAPPAKPVKETGAVLADAARLELLAARYK